MSYALFFQKKKREMILARWGTAVPKAVHQGLAPCGRGSCPRSSSGPLRCLLGW